MEKKKTIRSNRIFIELPDLQGKRFSLKVDGIYSVAGLPESPGVSIVHLGKTYGSSLSYDEVFELINRAIRHLVIKSNCTYSESKSSQIVFKDQ